MEKHSDTYNWGDPPTSDGEMNEVRQDIIVNLYGPTKDFMKKYFGNLRFTWQNNAIEVFLLEESLGTYPLSSEVKVPDDFLGWFQEYQDKNLQDGPGSWYVSPPKVRQRPSQGRCLLTNNHESHVDAKNEWQNVFVVGEVEANANADYQEGLLRLCWSARQVFMAQPARRFLHGFYIRGYWIEYWAFDRSGPYCSNVTDFRDDFGLFFSILISYPHLSKESGQSDLIMRDDGGNYTLLKDKRKLYLDDVPIAQKKRILGTGVTVYKARWAESQEWTHALKFKWRWVKARPEGYLPKVANSRKAWGAISVDDYEEFGRTSELRRDLTWDKGPLKLLPKGQVSSGDLLALNDLADNTEDTGQGGIYADLVLTRSLTSPLGRPLHTFQTQLELLQVFRDAVKCHRSLFQDANILHHDISAGSIVILDDKVRDGQRGMLIDMDFSTDLGDPRRYDPKIAGTLGFLAIGVMKGEVHSYRHDLESFLFVFLFVVVSNHKESLPEGSRLRSWFDANNKNLVKMKTEDMSTSGFEKILEEFIHEYQPLREVAKRLHALLFANGEVQYNSAGDTTVLQNRFYNGMLGIFDEAIAAEEGTQKD